jgi:hypothetical protein
VGQFDALSGSEQNPQTREGQENTESTEHPSVKSSSSFRRAGMNVTSGATNLVPILCLTASRPKRLENAMHSTPTSSINHGSQIGERVIVYVALEQAHDFFNRPDVVRDASFHRWRGHAPIVSRRLCYF